MAGAVEAQKTCSCHAICSAEALRVLPQAWHAWQHRGAWGGSCPPKALTRHEPDVVLPAGKVGTSQRAGREGRQRSVAQPSRRVRPSACSRPTRSSTPAGRRTQSQLAGAHLHASSTPLVSGARYSREYCTCQREGRAAGTKNRRFSECCGGAGAADRTALFHVCRRGCRVDGNAGVPQLFWDSWCVAEAPHAVPRPAPAPPHLVGREGGAAALEELGGLARALCGEVRGSHRLAQPLLIALRRRAEADGGGRGERDGRLQPCAERAPQQQK